MLRLATPLAALALTLMPLMPASARDTPAGTTFDAFSFFVGNSRGTGRLKIIMKPAVAVDVRSYGRVEKGTLVLVQTIEEGDKDRRRREWRIRQTAPGHYAGTLTDAKGPVSGTLVGGRLKLSYKTKDGLGVTQWIEAAPDGRSAHNLMTVTKFGMPVAHLDETIRREGN